MVYDIIPLIIIIISLAIIVFIIVRRFPNIAAIDTSTIASEKNQEAKKKIIAERLKRNLIQKRNLITLGVKPLILWLESQFKKIYQRVTELERHYQKESKKIMSKQEKIEYLEELFKKAQELVRAGNLEEAEQKYVEIISLDSQNTSAYKALGNIYFERKEYDGAKETFEHLLKLGASDHEIHFSLGQIFRALGEGKEALAHFKEAVELEPNNPRNLDTLIEESIMVGNKSLAEKTLEQLKEANPENQKLEEFKERIKQL